MSYLKLQFRMKKICWSSFLIFNYTKNRSVNKINLIVIALKETQRPVDYNIKKEMRTQSHSCLIFAKI